MMQINYYLRPTIKNRDSFEKILEYLISFVGDIEIKKESENSAIIYYVGTPTIAFIKTEKTGQLTVTISPDDNATISLIKNISQSLGFRIYNSEINCYLPNDVNLYDLATIKVDQSVKSILSQYHLTPLFQYRDSLIFFAKASDESIHLVNRHFLEYLIASPTNKQSLLLRSKTFKSEFSVKVAGNISQFVALFDRGLISLINPKSKIINLSGFDILPFGVQKLPENTKLNVINFTFDKTNQQFVQQNTTNKIPKKYLALKIGQDYTYSMIGKKLTKFLNISVFNI